MKGNIKWFNENKGYGFIVAEDKQEYFFHKSGLSPDCQPFEGAPIVFDEGDGRKGPKAVNIRNQPK